MTLSVGLMPTSSLQARVFSDGVSATAVAVQQSGIDILNRWVSHVQGGFTVHAIWSTDRVVLIMKVQGSRELFQSTGVQVCRPFLLEIATG